MKVKNENNLIFYTVPHFQEKPLLNGISCWLEVFKVLSERRGAMPEFEALCSRVKELDAPFPSIPEELFRFDLDEAGRLYQQCSIQSVDDDLVYAMRDNVEKDFRKKNSQERLEDWIRAYPQEISQEQVVKLKPFLKEFLEFGIEPQFGKFLQDQRLISRAPIFEKFLTAVSVDFKGLMSKAQPFEWEELPVAFRGLFLQKFAIMAASMGSRMVSSTWNPELGIEHLMVVLNQEGPLVIHGSLGEEFHKDHARETHYKVADISTYEWSKKSTETFRGFYRCGLLIGASKEYGINKVYYKVPGNEKVFEVSFHSFCQSIQPVLCEDRQRGFKQVYAYRKF